MLQLSGACVGPQVSVPAKSHNYLMQYSYTTTHCVTFGSYDSREANILTCYKTLDTTQNQSPSLESSSIMHQVIMLNELAAEWQI